MKKIFITLALFVAALSAQAQLLYKISGKDLKAPSYIVGTYHLAEVAFVDSIPGIRQALADCQQVYGELDMSSMANPENIMKMQQAMMLPEGKTLDKLLSADEMSRLNAYMNSLLGMDMTNPMVAQQMGRLTPQALSTQFSLLTYMKKHAGFDPQNPFDGYFQKVAQEQGKGIGGLETLDLQIKVLFHSMSLERQKQLLMCLVDNQEFMDKLADDVIRAFYSQNLEGLKEAMDRKMGNACDNTPEEDAALIGNRNADWLTKMPAIMAAHPTFFAVGAGHLPGEKGVLNLLRQAGYTVEGVR
ncbi:MAG: TraB/GumN family protein [Prevotella sp.]|nr:TraB/GumN family protein [Prevotella sp.]